MYPNIPNKKWQTPANGRPNKSGAGIDTELFFEHYKASPVTVEVAPEYQDKILMLSNAVIAERKDFTTWFGLNRLSDDDFHTALGINLEFIEVLTKYMYDYSDFDIDKAMEEIAKVKAKSTALMKSYDDVNKSKEKQ